MGRTYHLVIYYQMVSLKTWIEVTLYLLRMLSLDVFLVIRMVSSIHAWWLMTVCNTNSRRSPTFLGTLWASVLTCAQYPHTDTVVVWLENDHNRLTYFHSRFLLVTGFEEAVEPVGGRALLELGCHWRWVFRVYRFPLLQVHHLCLLCVTKMVSLSWLP